MSGIWNWQGVLAWFMQAWLNWFWYLRAIMMVELQYRVTMMKYAMSATLKDTNLNTFIMLTIRMTERMSENIQFLPDAHHPTTTGILINTPSISIILTYTFLKNYSLLCRRFILKEYRAQMDMIETESTIEMILAILRMTVAALGSQRVSSPKVRMLVETRITILYPYSMPNPLKEFHLPMWVATIRINVAQKMRINPLYSKNVALNLMLQFSSYQNVPTGSMLIFITSKQFSLLNTEGQLF